MTGPAPYAAADDPLERAAARLFTPMDKLAFGVAIGVATGLLLFALTAVDVLRDEGGRVPLSLLAQYLAGYRESWTGAAIALAWGLAVGFVVGWFTAFLRNLVLALWRVALSARADLAASRDFLDHI